MKAGGERRASSASDSGAQRERQLTMGHCHAVGCGDVIAIERVLCEKHEALLWPDIRALLYAKYRPGKKPSKVFSDVLERALYEILRAQQLGARVPRSQDFEWNDDVPNQPSAEVAAARDRQD